MRFAMKVTAPAVLITLTLSFSLWSASASAEPFTPCGSFGAPGSLLGQFAGESPLGIGVNASSGAAYIFDDGPNQRVEKFAAVGKCKYGEVSEFNGSSTPAGSFAEEDVGLAVDNSSGASKGDVYVSDTGHNVVDRFSASGEYLGQVEVSAPDGVAVDGEGNLYVTTFSDKSVHEFNASGQEVGTLTGSLLSGLLFGVAVDAQGNVYVVNNSTNIVKLSVSGGVVTHEAIIDSQKPTAVATGTSGRVYALNTEGEAHVTLYSTQGKEIEAFGSGETGFSLALAFGPVGAGGGVFVADLVKNEVHVAEQGTVKALPEPPELSACHVTSITRTSAKAGCTINPNAPKAEWHIEYGEVGSVTLTEVPGGEVTSTKSVQGELTNLKAGTAYVFKLVATNVNGTSEEESEFSSLPAVAGLTECAAGALVGTTATLKAALEPEGLATALHFEYGLTTSYGTSTADQETESSGVFEASTPVVGLEGNATYHCRLVASNSFGSTDGKDGVFTTPLVEPLVDQPPSVQATRTTAILRGIVNPENSPTTYRFQYVEAARYKPLSANPYADGGETPSGSAGEHFGEVPVGPQQIEGLLPATEYHYRIVAENEANTPGVVTDGPDHTFSTLARALPSVSVGPATAVGQSTATILATIDPSGLPTVYQFEVGIDGSFEGAPVFGSAGEGEEGQQVSASLSGLAPATTYAYRVTARNADGQQTSAVLTFTTASLPASLPEPSMLPLIEVPTLAFPPPAPSITPNPPLSRAKKLAKALKACTKKTKSKRAACERKARKLYGPLKPKQKNR